MSKTSRIWLTTGLLVSATAVSAFAVEVNLSGAVDTVLKRNPGVAAGKAMVEAARAGRRATDNSRFPRLGARAGFTRGDDPTYVFGTLLRQQTFGMQNFAIDALNNPGLLSDLTGALEVGVPVFTAFQIQTGRKLGALAVQQAETDLKAGHQGLRSNVIEIYLQVLLKRELAHTLETRIAAAEQEMQSAIKLKEKGLVLGSDFEAAHAVLGGLRMQLTSEHKKLEAVRETLAILMDVNPSELDLKGTLALGVTAYRTVFDDNRDDLMSRPDLKRADLLVDAAGIAARGVRLSVLPHVEAFAALETHSRDLSANPTTKIFGVRANLPFGDPAYSARGQASRARHDASREAARNIRESARIELLQAQKAYEGARETLGLAEETLAHARSSIEKFLPLYRQGKQSILEVLRAERGLVDAEAARLEVLYGIQTGYARVLAAAGRMDSSGVIELEKRLMGEVR